jgi:dephospho-CoA kinase
VRVFGLTGGIASGKTTVAQRFEEQGVPVVYADELARRAVEKGSSGLAAVVERFGAQVLDRRAELDRKALGALVFGKPAELAALNAIVHPRVGALGREAFAALMDRGVALACYEVPLLIENGLYHAFRPVVLVAADPEIQRARIIARDGLSSDEADKRIAAQLPLAEKLKVADHVIENRGSLEDLRRRADQVLAAIRASPLEEA